MAPKSHGEKKGWPGLFYLPNGWNFQFCWFNLIFLIALSWSESNFILFLFFYSIRVGPSRSELIRPGLAVRVDPVRLLYLPFLKGRLGRGLLSTLSKKVEQGTEWFFYKKATSVLTFFSFSSFNCCKNIYSWWCVWLF